MEDKNSSAETQAPQGQSGTATGEGQPTEAAVSEGPQWATTVITLTRLEVPEEELDIMALVHRISGVDKVWMELTSLTVVYDPSRVTRDDMVSALERRGYRVRDA